MRVSIDPDERVECCPHATPFKYEGKARLWNVRELLR